MCAVRNAVDNSGRCASPLTSIHRMECVAEIERESEKETRSARKRSSKNINSGKIQISLEHTIIFRSNPIVSIVLVCKA